MGVTSTTPISLKYRVRDTFAVNIFEAWRTLPVLENKSSIFNSSLTKQMFFEKRFLVNNDKFAISNDLVDDILIQKDILYRKLEIKLGVYECRSHKREWIFINVENKFI